MLNELRVFVRAVELNSISAAARSLRLSPAGASHRIQQLEQHLGTRLMNRTTRSLQPTEAGRLFYEHALEVLSAVERAESSMATASGVAAGALRVTAPLGFGRRHLASMVADFQLQHPKVEIRLRLSDHMLDLLSESVDIAVRMAVLRDSTFVTRKLADCPRVLCAAPSYLSRHGEPAEPADLLNHNCLLLRFPGSTQFQWVLGAPQERITVPVTGRFDADDGDVLTQWALEGAGIVMKPLWEVANHVESGDLVPILTDHPPEPVTLALLYPHRQLLPARVKLFADFMMERTKKVIRSTGFAPLRSTPDHPEALAA